MEQIKFTKTHFIGSTPPEIFIGRHNYPHIYSGILSPIQDGDTDKFSNPETWFKNQLSIEQILEYRKKLIYSRFKTEVKKVKIESKFTLALNQVAMASKSLNAEFTLKKVPEFKAIRESSIPLIGNPALLKDIRIQENPKIERKVDSIVNEKYLKSQQAIKELYQSNIQISSISKILSAGLLGLKNQRKLVPTRWSITAVDDTISKEMLKKIRLLPEINEFQVFSGEYVGNHYEILLLPDKFSFEVIEIATKNLGIWQDFENFNGRKKYASSVTGAYYVNRLALCEYLLSIKRQASCIFFREIKPTYYAPLGVGILRELSRSSFKSTPQKFQTLQEAITHIQSKLNQPVTNYTNLSFIIKNFGKQKKLKQWF